MNTLSLIRKKMVRMPWQDIHCYVSGSVAVDVAKNFVERYSFVISIVLSSIHWF
jgi:phosphatidylserine/phosphatidylglycerophosphate/cardiolipin synthase-like enzyme